MTRVVENVEAYSHYEHNQEKYKTQLDPRRYRTGQDLLERDWDAFDNTESSLDLPQREKPDAGFIDVDPNSSLK
ncbi:hypothetical protein BGX26_010785 [Mortierella sp. AD094]|nr:hypothetical protein BGX26_010785 [Mortierella sp. AD094]